MRGVAKRSVGVAGWGVACGGVAVLTPPLPQQVPAPGPLLEVFSPPAGGSSSCPAELPRVKAELSGTGGWGGLGRGLGVPVGLGGAGAVAGGMGSSWVCEVGGSSGCGRGLEGLRCCAGEGSEMPLGVCGGCWDHWATKGLGGGVSAGQGGSRAFPWGRGSLLGGVGDVRSPQRRRRRRC